MEYIPAWIYEGMWRQRARACPRCEFLFTSMFDRGQCPQCLHFFDASAIYGLPSGLTLERAIELIVESQQAKLSSLKDLRSVNGFPIASTSPDRTEQVDWDWHRQWLQQAIERGGSLFVHEHTSAKSWSETYYVLRDSRVLAWMETAFCLGD